jgi:hypothetical protein
MNEPGGVLRRRDRLLSAASKQRTNRRVVELVAVSCGRCGAHLAEARPGAQAWCRRCAEWSTADDGPPMPEAKGATELEALRGQVDLLTALQTLRRELENFKARISLSGHDTYGAGEDWRWENRNDLVLAVALGTWWGEYARAGAGALVVG